MTLGHTARFLVRTAVCLAALSVGLADLVAAEPDPATRDLLRLVGADVGLCVEIPRLEQTVRRQAESELVARIRGLGPVQHWLAGKDVEKLRRSLQAAERLVDRPLDRFAADLLGEAIVLAVHPRGDGEPEAVLLLRAANERAVAEAFEAWKRADDELLTDEYEHAGRTFRHTRREGESGLFHTSLGPVVVLSESESRIRDALAAAAAAREEDAGGLLESERFRAVRGRVGSEAAVIAYVNPRAWDAAIDEPGDAVEQAVHRAWAGTDAVAVALDVRRGLVLESAMHFGPETVSNAWREFVEPQSEPSSFLDRVPSRAVLVAAARVDFAGTIEAGYGALSERERRRIAPLRGFVERRLLGGLDLFRDLLPAFGTDVGLYVVPRAELVSGAPPVDVLVAVQLSSSASPDDRPSPRETLDDLITAGMELWVALHNGRGGEPARIESREDDRQLVRWIEGTGPIRPGFALTPAFLVLTTDPALVAEFDDAVRARRLVDDATFRAIREEHFAEAGPLLFCNLAALREFVAEHEAFLIGELARQRGTTVEAVRPRWERLREVLGVFDVAFLAGRLTTDGVRVVAGAVLLPEAE